MRVAIAAVGFAALAYVFCCQNAGAVAVQRNSDQAGCGRKLARDANAVLRPRLSQVLSAAGRRSLCLPALLALKPGHRELTAIG